MIFLDISMLIYSNIITNLNRVLQSLGLSFTFSLSVTIEEFTTKKIS